MKKFYFLALAAVTAASAFGAGRQTAVNKFNAPMQVEQQTLTLGTPMTKAANVGFTSIDEVAGEYTWNYYGLLNGASGSLSGIVTLTVTDATTGEVTIDGLFSAGTGITGKVKGTVDLEAGTLTVANHQALGADSNGDQNYFYLKEINEEGDVVDGASAAENVVATISGKSFTFPEFTVFAIGDPQDENLGWWLLCCMNEFVEYTEPDDLIDLSEWKEYSNATMEDGWVIPGLKYNDGTYADPADFPLNVKVLQNIEDENLYALVDPYMTTSGFPLSSGQNGYIVLDLTDPEFVLVNPDVFSGYLNGTNRIYCINVESFYIAQGYTKDVIKSSLSGQITEWSTSVVGEDKITVTIPTCRFNFPGALDKLYSWNGRSDAMKAKIEIDYIPSGVKGIENADAQVAPVYYNLQGVRVDNPNGGLYIKCEGSKTTKVLVK